MKLFLASEAKHPAIRDAMISFVGGFEGKHLVYIPTAANGTGFGSWKESETLALARTFGATVDVVELESVNTSPVLERIAAADIIWMAGGMPGYLLYWIRRVELDKLLPELLSKGVPYIGSSAGSMVCSTTQSLCDWYIGETEPGASVIPGLGLVDFEIYPHFEDSLLPEIQKHWAHGTLRMIKNGEAIIVVDGIVQTVGEERVLTK